MGERVCVIVNPAAGRGRGARMLPQVAAAFARVGVNDIRQTSHAGDEARIAERAIAEGFTTLVAVGGDGTTTHVANAILKSGADTRLAVMTAGTGNDFAKVLGTDKCDMETVARLSVATGDARSDVGQIEETFFLNCVGFGFDVAVLEQTPRVRYLRGNALYLYAAARQLFGFRGFEVSVEAGASGRGREMHMLVVVANSPYFGGMFRIAPGASVIDGELDAVAILDVAPARRVALLAAATRGTHPSYAECFTTRARSFELLFSGPPSYEADGELHRARTATIRVTSCAHALRVVTAPGVTLS